MEIGLFLVYEKRLMRVFSLSCERRAEEDPSCVVNKGARGAKSGIQASSLFSPVNPPHLMGTSSERETLDYDAFMDCMGRCSVLRHLIKSGWGGGKRG